MAEQKKPVTATKTQVVKLQIMAGKANPAPPVGTALGPRGVNMMQFCKEFNDRTSNMDGLLPVLITIYQDKKFSFIIKKASVPILIKKELGLTSGSKEPGRAPIAKLTRDQAQKIAENKIEDMNAFSIDSAVKMVIGTAISMGIEIIE